MQKVDFIQSLNCLLEVDIVSSYDKPTSKDRRTFFRLLDMLGIKHNSYDLKKLHIKFLDLQRKYINLCKSFDLLRKPSDILSFNENDEKLKIFINDATRLDRELIFSNEKDRFIAGHSLCQYYPTSLKSIDYFLSYTLAHAMLDGCCKKCAYCKKLFVSRRCDVKTCSDSCRTLKYLKGKDN